MIGIPNVTFAESDIILVETFKFKNVSMVDLSEKTVTFSVDWKIDFDGIVKIPALDIYIPIAANTSTFWLKIPKDHPAYPDITELKLEVYNKNDDPIDSHRILFY